MIGGGIAGLAAAHALVAEGGVEVVLLEASERLGGKILTTPFAGRMVDEGPDAFLARVPPAVDLATDVGLGDDLVSPAVGRAFITKGSELLTFPAGVVLGVPSDLAALVRSRVVSARGVARAALDLALPGKPLRGDDSVGALVRRRLGPEVHERLVDPMLGSINAGRTEELSVQVAAPQIAAAAAKERSLVRALRAQLRDNPPDPSRPVFHAPRGGMATLVDALEKHLRAAGADIRTGASVDHLARTGARGWALAGAGVPGDAVDAVDAVIVATPGPSAARLVEPLCTPAAVALRSLEYASVAVVTFAYRRSAVGHPLDGSGFLVPRGEGRLLTACSFASTKWAHLAHEDSVVLRASAGRMRDDRSSILGDEELAARLHDELAELLGIAEAPSETRVSRWPNAFPQYRPGHLETMREAEAALLAEAPGLALAGAVRRGVGIPTCIATGQEAAATVLRALR